MPWKRRGRTIPNIKESPSSNNEDTRIDMEVVKEHYLLHSFTFRFQVNYNETTLLTVLVFLPNMKLFSFFSLLGISCLLIFEWIRNALLFFWPVIFLCWHLFNFWCFSEHETIHFFILYGQFVSTHTWEWIENALFFGHFDIITL